MSPIAQKTALKNTFSNISMISYQEKRSHFLDEASLNAFLDAILDFKKEIKDKSEKIENIIEGLENLTWFSDLDEECLILMNDLIAAAKDLHTSLIRQYFQLEPIREKGIATNELTEFKHAIDDLKESCSDLESVFFFLPEMPDFKETTKKLSLI